MYSGISVISGAVPDERAFKEERESSDGRADIVRLTGIMAVIAEAPFKKFLRLTSPLMNILR